MKAKNKIYRSAPPGLPPKEWHFPADAPAVDADSGHSPVPWHTQQPKGKFETLVWQSSPSVLLAETHGLNHEANAAFIVRACNNVERLADALRANVLSRLGSMSEACKWALEYRNDPNADRGLVAAVEALAQWEGSKQDAGRASAPDWKALAGQLADDMREIRDMAHQRRTRVNMQNGVSLGAFAGVSLGRWEAAQ